MIKLKIKNLAGETLLEKQLEKFPATIGRDPAADVSIPDGGVSTRHGELNWDGTTLTMKDLGSRNGTYFEEQPVTEMKVPLPCVFLLGNVVTMELESAAVPEAKAQEPKPEPKNKLPVLSPGRMDQKAVAIAPKAFKVPAPVRQNQVEAVPVETKPEPVMVEAFEIFGWEEYWLLLRKVHPRHLLIAMMSLSGLFFVMHYILFRENFFFSLGTGFGAAVGSAIGAAMVAGLFALPGLLFRGSYDFKPIFVQQCICLMLFSIQASILRPAMMLESFGSVARFMILPIIAVTSIASEYTLLFTSLPHRFEKKIFVASLVIAFLMIIGASKDVIMVERQTLLRNAILGEHRVTRSLAGKAMDVRDLTDDIRAFGQKFPAK